MEVEEEDTSKHLQESTTTTVSNESLLENNSRNDIELGIEVPESNTQEEQGEKSPVVSPQFDDPNHFVAVAVGETTEENQALAECSNSEPGGAANDGISTSDAAATEPGGSELPNSTKLNGGESEAAVILRDSSLDVVEKDINNSEGDTNTNDSLATENDKDGGEGKMETVKVDEAGEALEEGGGVDVPLLPITEIGEREEVMEDVGSDGIGIVLGDDAEVVADEEEGPGKTAGEDKATGGTENDEEEPTMADEEKSLDTELDSDEEKVPPEEMETELAESGVKSGRRKRKRGKNAKATPKSTTASKQTIEEDVCFVCFDGGDLVLCDVRTCPKAYHPSCVNRDAAFFQTKGRWNCDWHLCTNCQKKAEYMCYTCTFSLCKSCIKTDVILLVNDKDKKGFCEPCVKTIMLIEKNSQENQEIIDFNDKNSWEYLFKDYWTDTKSKLNLTLEDLLEAKNPAGKQESPAVHSDSDNPSTNLQTKATRTRKHKKTKQDARWASNELLEFVAHMTGGDTSHKSQFDIQALLLEYIKTNKLRDSRRKSYIMCDARLSRLFGKPRVGHFEMLKLLESHFLVKEDSQMDDADYEGVHMEEDEGDENVKSGKVKKGKIKMRKKVDREVQSNREDYAAIDAHNISLIYVRRKLAEDSLKDSETFCKKVVGTFVRIRIPSANNKNDIYRLVQVTGTTKTAEYSVGKQTTDIMLEILNLDKTEAVAIDTISNQEFTEEECKRLRQSIKYGFINRLKVGDILDKAMELQASRVDDWLETEVLRLSHLRDRASDLGRKKELRECVEKIQLLKSAEERARRLQDLPLIHDDPTMDPNHVSEDDDSDKDDNTQDTYKTSKRDYPWKDTSTSRGPHKNYEYTNKTEEKSQDQGRETIVQQPVVVKRNEVIPETGPSETDKLWFYKDPSGKIQGPFSMGQLRKWNNNKFFPVDLRIWKKSEKEDDGVVLTDALEGRFVKKRAPKHDEREGLGLSNLPSPTPNQSVTGLFHGGNEGLKSPTPSGPRLLAFGGGTEQGYNQWGGAGNFLPPPPPLPAPVNLPPPPQQLNLSWGNQNMNWGSNVQGPQLTGTVNVNSISGVGWGGPPPAQGWIGFGQGNGNPSWVGPPNPSEMNQGGWVGGPSEIAWGPQNPGWSSPMPRSRGMWDTNEQQHQNYNTSGGFSGQQRGSGDTRH